MRILALIPARGGSKRLPGKNIKLLGGLPLIAWTIRAAFDSGCCKDVLVSTDNEQIAKTARQYGASVPWLRPPELATDTASSIDMTIHAVDTYENENGPIDGVLLLQPTSPFRSGGSIRHAVTLFSEGTGGHTVVSVSPASSHPAWCFRQTDAGIEPFLGWPAAGQRSQDLEAAWMLNGSIYLISPTRLRTERTFLAPDTKLLVMSDADESIDVDTQSDFALCEARVHAVQQSTK